MRVEWLSVELGIKDGGPLTLKKEVPKLAIQILAIGVTGGKYENFTVQSLKLVNFSLKKIRLYVKCLSKNNAHTMFEFANSKGFLINN